MDLINKNEMDENAFSLYVHWPFCVSKCPYCDFNSWVSREEVDQQRYLKAYTASLDRLKECTNYQSIKTIFFGGGSPSLMEPSLVGAILDHAAKNWQIADNVEITLEANPSSSEADKFSGFSKAGVNRLSLGVQSLRNADLKALGRAHDVDEAKKAIEMSQQIFPRTSFDLIYAREGQTVSDWERELNEALELAGEHLSLYQLTIEPETTFAKLYERGELILPDDDQSLAFLQLTRQMCADKGLYAYEVSNHARKGAESQHNLVYWRYQPYAGIGPGAHGRLRSSGCGLECQSGEWCATFEPKNPRLWLDAKEDSKQPKITKVSMREQADEMLLMGLRLEEGVSLKEMGRRTGYVLANDTMAPLVEEGLLHISNNYLSAKNIGKFLINALVRELSKSLKN